MGAEGDPGQGLTNIAFMDQGLGVLLLLEGHLPHTRARRLQLLSNILRTRLDSKKTTPENILKFEDSIEEYGKASGDVVQDDLRVSVVLGNTEGPRLLLNVKETAKYATLRQFCFPMSRRADGLQQI